MSDMTSNDTGAVLTTRDGVPLKVSLAKALRREKLRALLLIVPLLIFILVTFIAPIADMLFRSVENDIVPNTLPKTVVALENWDSTSGELPGDEVYVALFEDLKIAVAAKEHTKLGSRLNYDTPGISSIFRKTGRKVKRLEPGNEKEKFIDIHKGWGELTVWKTIKRLSGKYTDGYYLSAVDAKKTDLGIEAKPENEQIYFTLFGRTFFMSVLITGMCILLGYPIAFLLANLPLRTSNLLLILVLLPFWTSLLVRTSAWKVLLQQQGVVNDTLHLLGA